MADKAYIPNTAYGGFFCSCAKKTDLLSVKVLNTTLSISL